ncbi:MAG: class I SAM-dependent methyltransferase [Actinomycetota bacterium]|nr:class I SAM-dependent methyltransferase [Actinomycetota bacterium]MDQ2981418.1 class I SAM-dependent methyltransferase [Actinomycetota bacterium]
MLTGLAARASLWNRKRKLGLFLDELGPGPETTIVDVGVGDTGFSTEPGVALSHNFFEALYPWPERITAVSDVPLPNFAQEFPAISWVTASGTDLPFEDDSFDIAFSNAVLEHVGGRKEQRRFVHELCRVAPRVFVSTPNRWFPVEVHTLVPFAHWLPRRLRDRVFVTLRRDAWAGVELLGRRDLTALFPENVAARVLESRMTISVVATRPARISDDGSSK